ncbi:hypothetical protein COX03_01415 [Candidatus Woesebacteria bacterium CG22_combo_CG10-13_8_21_14_all_39_10]|uniref:Uncharacterized protein n=2 Tax=Patescibacteria group TaxID=1783273 RepID=A0A2M7D7Y4_9BACT|nr:MAG: hypothetical protein COX03_01415 [Candidatus Woesebacteria bacterium CG22_combo_CG10-13_8_21_14_all_39_10]PIV42594.1 MAG: hypothetical protein COS26_01745 [Candidatus Nealsonbacteria bacterium CG02_land_8_20_14_3_00_40_11]
MKNLTFGLYSLSNTVFTTREIAIILGENNLDKVKSRINYYVGKGILIQLRRGIFAKKTGYEILEAANKIFTPSYISLETVLQREGVTFQDYSNTIFVISYQTREIKIENFRINFKKIKDEILTNSKGIITQDGYSIATVERAFLDALYLYKDYYFDNLDPIDWKKAEDLVDIYESIALEERFKKHAKHYHT